MADLKLFLKENMLYALSIVNTSFILGFVCLLLIFRERMVKRERETSM